MSLTGSPAGRQLGTGPNPNTAPQVARALDWHQYRLATVCFAGGRTGYALDRAGPAQYSCGRTAESLTAGNQWPPPSLPFSVNIPAAAWLHSTPRSTCSAGGPDRAHCPPSLDTSSPLVRLRPTERVTGGGRAASAAGASGRP